MTYIPKPEDWFTQRIGKRIYRDKTTCKCQACLDVEEHGLVVRDEQHAQYLADIDMDFGAEGVFCNYRDAKHPLEQ